MVSGANKNKLSGVILAAGFSSRMNAWKMELNIKGRPLLYYTIRPMLEVCS
ncbi:MAG: NTP transferase domain-containing protein, partial [Ignavibacteria bacterium]|nr:NTP transferase domain-containing protein [Ignavibacteria bacterium]MCU7524858.1 NTP transferase domain-containing protein [Ignavibacteria bacterium]